MVLFRSDMEQFNSGNEGDITVCNICHYIDLGAVVSMLSHPFESFIVFVTCHNLYTGLSKRFGCGDEWVVVS